MSRAPAFLAAIAFAAGVWLAAYAWRPPTWWLVASVVLAVGALMLRQRGFAGCSLALLALVALGALDIVARDAAPKSTANSHLLDRFLSSDQVQITARVLRDSTSRPRGNSTTRVVDVETECIAPILQTQPPDASPTTLEPQPLELTEQGESVDATMRPRRARSAGRPKPVTTVGDCVPLVIALRVTVYPHDVDEDNETDSSVHLSGFLYGQRLRLTARLREPRNFGNPDAWDYIGYLHNAGVVALGSVRSDRVELLPGLGGTRIRHYRARLRRSVLDRINALWTGPAGRLIAAMVVGDKSDLRRDIRTDFQRTGIFHILVVSGMNVGIIAFVIFWVLRRLRIGDLTSSVLTVVLSCAYAFITDGGPPILRATLMLAIYLAARLLYRDHAALNAVGLAALVLLVADPRALFDASFQLTFLAVIAIAGIAMPLLERTCAPYKQALRHLDSLAYDLTLPPRLAQFRLDIRLLERKAGALIGKKVARSLLTLSLRSALSAVELFVVSAVAQCALALPMAVYFHRAVLVGLPANLIVVPLTGILMPAATVAVALAYISPLLAKPAAWVTSWSLDAILWTVRVIGGWRASDWRIPAPTFWIALFCAAAVAFCIYAVRRNRWFAVAGCATLAISAAGVALVPPRPQIDKGRMEFTAIDVGQADSTLIVTPAGSTILVDAAGSFGPFQSEFDFGEDVISPYLWSRGITRLDAVVITHAHSDHIGGMRSVVANFRPRELWLGPNSPDPVLDSIVAEAQSRGMNIRSLKTPDAFSFGGAEFHVFSPPGDWTPDPRDRNRDSLVLRVGYRESSALITGDADKRIEAMISGSAPRATVLHVAHNGSMTATSSEFLRSVDPRYAVISVGARNQFRHPRPEILERLAAEQVRTYRTDVNGAVTFLLDGAQVIPILPTRR